VAPSRAKRVVATNEGKAAGKMEPATTAGALAPVARRASTGPGSTSSILSAKNLPQKPTVSTAMARIPAAGPRPTVTTKIRPHTRSGTALRNETTPRNRP